MRLTLSLLTTLFITLVFILTAFNLSKWKGHEVLKHDMFVYYNYLPAAFIYDDLTFSYNNQIDSEIKREIWTLPADNGGRVQKMTMGMAYLYAPAFFLAHASAKWLGLPADGYGWIYHFFMAMSAIVYAFGGLLIQRKLLLKYFSDQAVAITLLAIGLGTNFYYYTTSEGPMSHIHNFFLISLFVWQSILWLESFKWKNGLLAAFAIALIVLIRPTNILVVIIPLLYGVRSFAELAIRVGEVFRNPFQLGAMLAIMALVVAPQLFYWHQQTGQWIYYSYNDEGFFFNDPRVLEGWFSFRKGWLVYSPVMLFSLLGIVSLFMTKLAKKFQIAVPVFLLAFSYVTFSWWCWWYGGSFGSRPMIDAAAILTIPMAAFFNGALSKRYVSFQVLVVVTSLVGLNLFQSMQYRRGIIHWDSMTKKTYFLVAGKTNYPAGYEASLKVPDYDAAKKGFRDE